MNENFDYEYKIQSKKTSKEDINSWKSEFGYKVISRNSKGKSEVVEFSVYTNNPHLEIYLIGDFNNWNTTNPSELLTYSKGFHKIQTSKIQHKERYKYLVINHSTNEKEVFCDPATTYFDDEGNSLFWDFEDPNTKKISPHKPKLTQRSIKILQSDLPGLITHYSNQQTVGHKIPQKEYYLFIKNSGIIEEIKNLGFNTIQFLPFAQSIDGDNWKYRYLVPFQFALQKNWGTPDDFIDMINEFHKQGIAVIADLVIGHIPFKEYKIFGQESKNFGIHNWNSKYFQNTYLDEETFWGTKRFRFSDENVRKYIISSAIHFQKYYGIDGFRIDNVDGILRHGQNGDEEEREGGRELLRELNKEIYKYNPHSYIHYEAHYFYGDNAKNLVAPINSSSKALGCSAYNSSRLTHYFHTTYMFKSADEISPWKIKHIMEEKEWGKSNSTVADFHNHDAAAGLMPMRCTGAYAYECMKSETIDQHIHTVGKLKVMEAIISFCCEGRTLDLLQTWILQKGTFEHDSSIHWHLTYNETHKAMLMYKKKINEIMDFEEFFPENVENREFLNIDDINKILVVQRESKKHISVVIINMGSWKHHKYKVGIKERGIYKTIFNSDKFEYNGFGISSFKEEYESYKSKNFELLNQEIELDQIPPYGIIILRKEK